MEIDPLQPIQVRQKPKPPPYDPTQFFWHEAGRAGRGNTVGKREKAYTEVTCHYVDGKHVSGTKNCPHK